MKYILLLTLLSCGCQTAKEYTTQCNFNIPVDKPIEKTTITVELKARY